jgi:hypothetical protein
LGIEKKNDIKSFDYNCGFPVLRINDDDNNNLFDYLIDTDKPTQVSNLETPTSKL